MMTLLYIVIGFVIGFFVCAKWVIAVFNKNPGKVIAFLREYEEMGDREKGVPPVKVVNVEHDEEKYFVYEYTTGSFITYAATELDALAQAQQKFPDHVLVCYTPNET